MLVLVLDVLFVAADNRGFFFFWKGLAGNNFNKIEIGEFMKHNSCVYTTFHILPSTLSAHAVSSHQHMGFFLIVRRSRLDSDSNVPWLDAVPTA